MGYISTRIGVWDWFSHKYTGGTANVFTVKYRLPDSHPALGYKTEKYAIFVYSADVMIREYIQDYFILLPKQYSESGREIMLTSSRSEAIGRNAHLTANILGSSLFTTS